MNTGSTSDEPTSTPGPESAGEVFMRALAELLTRETLGEDITDPLNELLRDTARADAERIIGEQGCQLGEEKTDRVRFEARLESRWGTALDLFELLVSEARAIGSAVNETHRPTAAQNNSHKFEALIRLHGKAVTTCGEILTLLRSGFSSGALARARTLHEIAVMAFTLEEGDDELARRYLSHHHVETHKAQKDFENYYARLAYEGPETSVEERDRTQERLAAEFGAAFLKDLGWAEPLFGHAPKFRELEERVELDHWRPYYRMSSHPVHATSKGILWNIQLLGNRPVIVAGPSDAGLIEPAQLAGISLFQVSVVLLKHQLDFYDEDPIAEAVSVVQMHTLDCLLQRAIDAFMVAHRDQRAEVEAFEQLTARVLAQLVSTPGSTTYEIAVSCGEDAQHVAAVLARCSELGLVVDSQAWQLTPTGEAETHDDQNREMGS